MDNQAKEAVKQRRETGADANAGGLEGQAGIQTKDAVKQRSEAEADPDAWRLGDEFGGLYEREADAGQVKADTVRNTPWMYNW